MQGNVVNLEYYLHPKYKVRGQGDAVKVLPQGVNVSFLFRIATILCILLLSLLACLVGTVAVAFVVGRIFSTYFP